MKKIAVLATLPVIALASCGKEDNQKKEVVNNAPINTQTQNNTTVKESSPVNENINTTTTNETGLVKKEFKLTYDLPDGRPLKFNGNLEIENGIIKSVNFPEYDLTNDVTYEVKFAKEMQINLVGKTLKGLQYDGMTGASLTTDAFNAYLNTINK